jgi:hypothetical protein
MDTCANCQAQLAPEWNYCIRCGNPVARSSTRIPGAIRPDPDMAPRHRTVDARLLLWGAVGAVGLLVVILALVNMLGSHVG